MSVLGARLLSHGLKYLSMNDMLGDGITVSHFMGTTASAFEYVAESVRGGRYPSVREVAERFSIDFGDVDRGDYYHLCDMVRTRHVMHLMAPHIENGMKAIEKKDVLSALDHFGNMQKLRALLIRDDDVHSFKHDSDERVEDYYKSKEHMAAIPSMWPSFNKWTGGWCDSTFFVVTGFTTVGKSWFLVITACDIVRKIQPDECVLLISTEMSKKRLARRIDSVMYKLNFIALRDGTLDEVDEARWGESLIHTMSGEHPMGDIIVVDSRKVKTVDDILALNDKYNPRLNLIDGGYRLKAPGARGDWEKQVAVIEGIQAGVIVTGSPWVVTAQMGDAQETGKGMAKRSAGRWNMRYAKEWLINPDIVTAMTQNEDLELVNEMEFALTKLRDAEKRTARFRTHWDKKKFDYSEIEDSVDDF